MHFTSTVTLPTQGGIDNIRTPHNAQMMIIDSAEMFADFNKTLARVAEFVGLPEFNFKYDPTHQRKGECKEGGAGYGPEFFAVGGRRVLYCLQGTAVGYLDGGSFLLNVSLLFQEQMCSSKALSLAMFVNCQLLLRCRQQGAIGWPPN